MDAEFEKGNVSTQNTGVGDTVLYVISKKRGNGCSIEDQYFWAIIKRFTVRSISIEVSGVIVNADPRHLFTEEALNGLLCYIDSP